MITIESGKLTIPDEDRLLCLVENETIGVRWILQRHFFGRNYTYKIYLRFDDGTVRSAPLSAEISDNNTMLTWRIDPEQLYSSGIAEAQVQMTDSAGNLTYTTRDFFLVEAASTVGSAEELLTTGEMENRLIILRRTLAEQAPYADAQGYWYLYDAGSGRFLRSELPVSGSAIDSAMNGDSDRPVSNRAIKTFVENGLAELSAGLISEIADTESGVREYSKAYTDAAVSGLAPLADVYQKSEIDSMIGDLESVLAAV